MKAAEAGAEVRQSWLFGTRGGSISCPGTGVGDNRPQSQAACSHCARFQVVRDALDKPRQIEFKGATDLVTETDKAAEAACLAVVQAQFPEHMVLGEEGGVMGPPGSEYLWCIDPLDGTTNFAHSYPSFAVSVGVLRNSVPVAACVVEFTGGALPTHQPRFQAVRPLPPSPSPHATLRIAITRLDVVEQSVPLVETVLMDSTFTGNLHRPLHA